MNHTSSHSTLPVRKLTDAQLVARADLAVRREHASIIALLESLAEIDRRTLYLAQGYSSLFDYCTRRWGYSPATAGRYISAARAAARFPRVRELLEKRRMTVCAVARLASTLTDANCDALTAQAAGRTFAEVEALVQTRRPAPRVPDRVRMIGVGPVRAATATTGTSLALALGGSTTGHERERSSAATMHTQSAEAATPERLKTDNGRDGDVRTGRDQIGTEVRGREAYSAQSNETAQSRVRVDHDANATIDGASYQRGSDEGDSQRSCAGADPQRDGARSDYQRGSASADDEPRAKHELRYEIRFAARQAFVEKLERAKSVCSNKTDLESVLERALDDLLDRRDPERRSKRRLERRSKRRPTRRSNRPSSQPTDSEPSPATAASPTSPTIPRASATSVEPAPRTRHIPTEIQDAVFLRDGGQCTYVSPAGVRCAARVFLQFDHVVPYASGGPHTEENLRLRCGRHNRARENVGSGTA